MDAHLTTTIVRDGPVRTLIVRGELDLFGAGAFLEQAVLAIDSRTDRLVLDLAGVTFLDCTGSHALAMAATFAPAGCPVIVRSVSAAARRILALLGLDLENPGELDRDTQPRDELWARAIRPQEPGSGGGGRP
jgi:anti-anti-sigma factor